MTEDLKDTIGAALPEQLPPAEFDTESILRGGRRSRRRRQWTIAGTSATGIAAVAAVAVLIAPALAPAPEPDGNLAASPKAEEFDPPLDEDGDLIGWPHDAELAKDIWDGTGLDDQVYPFLQSAFGADIDTIGSTVGQSGVITHEQRAYEVTSPGTNEQDIPESKYFQREYSFFVALKLQDGTEESVDLELILPGGWVPGIGHLDGEDSIEVAWSLLQCDSGSNCDEWTEGEYTYMRLWEANTDILVQLRPDGSAIRMSYGTDETPNSGAIDYDGMLAIVESVPSPVFDPEEVPGN